MLLVALPERAIVAFLVVVAVLLGGLGVVQADSHTSGVIQACVDKDGKIRLLDPRAPDKKEKKDGDDESQGPCKKKEILVQWNIQGVRGLKGDPGPVGDAGPTGPQGIQGLQGATGTPGLIGPAGSQGLQGDPGPVGDAGPTGPQGIQGLQGATGTPGLIGPAGPGATGRSRTSG